MTSRRILGSRLETGLENDISGLRKEQWVGNSSLKKGDSMQSKRHPTKYPGVFYRIGKRIGGPGKERVYYVIFKKANKGHEEKVGRQFVDDLTPARAARIRGERIEGKRLSRKESRQREQAQKAEAAARWTIDRLWEEYAAGKPASKGLRVDTNRYEHHLKAAFGEKELKDILPLDVDRVRIRLSRTRKPQTVKHVLALLRRISGFAVKKQICEGLRFPVQVPRVNNTRTEDLTHEELARLLAAINADPHAQAGAIMKAALFTGMRRGELFKLTWQDIDFERGFIHIRDPKGGPDQTIPLNAMARALFEKHPRTQSPFVFSGKDGGRQTNINRPLNAVKKAAGLPKNFRPLHGLRHVYASMLASSGQVDLYVLQPLLTHKDSRMTQRYAHLRDEALRRASDVAGGLLEKMANGATAKMAEKTA